MVGAKERAHVLERATERSGRRVVREKTRLEKCEWVIGEMSEKDEKDEDE